MRYLSYDEVRLAENKIGKFLLSLSEDEIDFIKEIYIDDSRGFEREENVDNLEWDLCHDPILGYYLDDEVVSRANSIVRSFYMRLHREKYPRRYRQNILLGDNPSWQRNHRKWRRAVFERDDYICQECGSNKNLHAHHIKARSECPEIEFDIDNGITLCKSCHAKKHPDIGLMIEEAR